MRLHPACSDARACEGSEGGQNSKGLQTPSLEAWRSAILTVFCELIEETPNRASPPGRSPASGFGSFVRSVRVPHSVAGSSDLLPEARAQPPGHKRPRHLARTWNRRTSNRTRNPEPNPAPGTRHPEPTIPYSTDAFRYLSMVNSCNNLFFT